MDNPTEQTYSINVQELIAAAKELLTIIEHIGDCSMGQLVIAWGRLHKAIETMETQEMPNGTPTP